jgi:hypothetical protein
MQTKRKKKLNIHASAGSRTGSIAWKAILLTVVLQTPWCLFLSVISNKLLATRIRLTLATNNKKQACLSLSNITAGSKDQIQVLHSESLFV